MVNKSKVSRRLTESTAPEVCEHIYAPRLARDFPSGFDYLGDINQAHLLMLHRAGLLSDEDASGLAQALLLARMQGFEHGACFVELAPVTQATAVPAAVAAALGMRLLDHENPFAALAQTLASLQVLIALDNAEHVLEAVAAGSGPSKFLMTLGYAGWSAGQLEEEITLNGWINVPLSQQQMVEIIFNTPSSQRYERTMGLLGFDPSHLSGEAGHA